MLDRLLLQEEYRNELVPFLDGETLNTLAQLDRASKSIVGGESSWKILCEVAGYKNHGATRTRGHRSSRNVYRDNLCVECETFRNLATIVFDLAGGSLLKSGRHTNLTRGAADMIGLNGSRVSLCSACLSSVTAARTWGSRKGVLPRLKHKDRISNTIWNALVMQKIPLDVSKVKKEVISRRARAEGVAESCFSNDHLLKKVV
jgi:hypothetical protein